MNMQHIKKSRLRSVMPFSRSRAEHPALDLSARMARVRALLDAGEAERACAMAEALAPLAPLDPNLLELRGICLTQSDRPSEAIALFDKALPLRDAAGLWAAKGRALSTMGRYRRAVASFERACALAPKTESYRVALAAAHLDAGAPADALDVPMGQTPDARLLQAKGLGQLGRTQLALQQAWTAADHDPAALHLMVDLARNQTEVEMARSKANECAMRPAASTQMIATCAKFLQGSLPQMAIDKLVAQMTSASASTRSNAAYGMFCVEDGRGNIGAASRHLQSYHTLMKANTDYRRSTDSAMFTFLSRLRFEPLPRSKYSIFPVFVSGLPGSGVKDAARMLQKGAQNPSARALNVVGANLSRFVQMLHNEGRRDVTREDLLLLQSELREGLRQAADGTDMVIDCAELNFRWSGLVSAALPEARIVHMRRDHLQTGWAIHRDGFGRADLPFQHDMTHLASYLLRAETLMHRWEMQSPNITGFSGDALCRPGHQIAKAILTHCNMSWSVLCESPHYAPSRDWHRYAPTVAPLRKTLKAFEAAPSKQLQL